MNSSATEHIWAQSSISFIWAGSVCFPPISRQWVIAIVRHMTWHSWQASMHCFISGSVCGIILLLLSPYRGTQPLLFPFCCRLRLIAHLGQPIALSRSEEHTSELQSLMRISYAVFCLKKKNTKINNDSQDTLTVQDR